MGRAGGRGVVTSSPKTSNVVVTVYLSNGYHAERECWRRKASDSEAEIQVKLCVVSKVCCGVNLYGFVSR